MFRVLPLMERPPPKITDWRFLPASDITKLLAVRVATLTFPAAVIWKILEPVEEATVSKGKIGLVEVPWTNNTEVGVAVPMPTLPAPVILSFSVSDPAFLVWKFKSLVSAPAEFMVMEL